MLLKRFLGPLIFSALFFIFSSPAFAQTLPTIVGANLGAYVPPTESECNINVPSQYATIQAGINAANFGDTICVGPGTYNENVTINKSIRLSGKGATQTTINGQITDVNPGRYTVLIIASNVTVEGFFIKGVGSDDGDSTLFIHNDSVSGATVRYNRIKAGSGELALGIADTQTDVLIQNDILEGVNSPYIAVASALRAVRSDNIDFLNNTFLGTVNVSLTNPDTGIGLKTGSTNGLFKQNAFNVTGTIRVLIGSDVESNIITENNLNSSAPIKVGTYSGGHLIAQYNWWGDIDPSDNIWGDVDYSNFVLGPFLEYPIPSFNEPPVANAGPDQTILLGQQASFDGSGSTDPNGASDIISYFWDFGDGNSATGVATVHTYLNSGPYTVTLTVTDMAGATSSDTLTVVVQTPPQATESLIDTVETFNLQQGIENSLDAKLSAAIDSLSDLNQNNNSAAINSLEAFINAVNAQRGNQITDAQADALIQTAQEILQAI